MAETVGSLDRPSMAHRAAEAIRVQLLSGQIPLGTPLRDTEWAERLAISRPTMREAFAELVRDGLLTHSLHRGVEVARPGLKDISDIYSARRVLEIAALANASMQPEVHDRMQSALEEMVTAARAGDTAAGVAADADFHLGLISALGVARMDEAARRFFRELRLVLSVYDHIAGREGSQPDAHAQLLRVVREGSIGAARTAFTAHLEEAERNVSAMFART